MPEQIQPVPRRKRRRRRRKKNPLRKILPIMLAVVVLAAGGLLIRSLFSSEEDAPEETAPEVVETQPEPVHVVSTATIAATGDILMHKPVFNTCLLSDGSYQFEPIFRYLKPYVESADFAVANLETTLCGTDNGYPYSGYPNFNTPDEIVDALKNTGFDLLLTANNHCYDTGEVGFLRTIKTVKSKGLDNLGTYASKNDPKYLIKEINGIKVGMLCYTYEDPPANAQNGIIYLNSIPMAPGSEELITSFLPSNLDPFLKEVSDNLDAMKKAGAEATVLFIHWGVEYQTIPNEIQRQIAQELTDLGVDVIVGGHPHVVQMVDMLNNRIDKSKKTLCLYSMGNAVSNQRASEMDLKTGHTEDGVLFQVTFAKYSDGTVYLEDADILPLWVDMRINATKEYDIIPLDSSVKDQWKDLFGLSDSGLTNALASLDRTNVITAGNINRAKNYLATQKEQREADYLAALSSVDDAA